MKKEEKRQRAEKIMLRVARELNVQHLVISVWYEGSIEGLMRMTNRQLDDLETVIFWRDRGERETFTRDALGVF